MAKRKAKNTKKEIASARKTRALKARHIAYICAEINSKRLPNGRLRRGELEKALKEHKPIIPWITIDLIKKGLKKDSPHTSITTTISDLTDSTGASSHDDISQTEIEPNNAHLEWILQDGNHKSKDRVSFKKTKMLLGECKGRDLRNCGSGECSLGKIVCTS